MTWLRRIVWLVLGLAGLWLAVLFVAGFALAGSTRRSLTARIGESLHADATLAGVDLSLIRGRANLDGLRARRDEPIGQLSLFAAELTCELPPLGAALLDRDCLELHIRGVRFSASSLALFRMPRPAHPPLHVYHLSIDDADLELTATELLPGLGKLAIHIDHADAGETTFKSPLSFLFSLRHLAASISLSDNATLRLTYDLGRLQIAGSLFGSTPLTLPVSIPVADLADDPAGELAKLTKLGKDLAEQVISQRAEAWLKAKLSL